MLRIFFAVALLASECSGYSSESSSESSSPTPSESSTCEDTPSEPSPHPCPPVAVGQCCDYCPFCKDENAICGTYGLAKMCICKPYYTFDYDCNECVPGDPNNYHGSDHETQEPMMPVARNGAPMPRLPYTPPCVLYRGWSYRYYDEIAQSYCASKLSVGYAFALRRNCVGFAPTCSSICAKAQGSILRYIRNQRTSVSCYNALNVRKKHNWLQASPGYTQLDANRVHTQTYSYGYRGCSWKPNHCGPNYCCCKAYGLPPLSLRNATLDVGN